MVVRNCHYEPLLLDTHATWKESKGGQVKPEGGGTRPLAWQYLVPKLRAALQELGLGTSGLKPTLVARLIEHQRANAPGHPSGTEDESRPRQRQRTERTVRERLLELSSLKEESLISQEEYDAKRREVLADL